MLAFEHPHPFPTFDSCSSNRCPLVGVMLEPVTPTIPTGRSPAVARQVEHSGSEQMCCFRGARGEDASFELERLEFMPALGR